MPETGKVNRPDEASSKTDEPGIGAKKTARHDFDSAAGIQNAPVSAEAGSPSPQTSPQSDGQEQAGITNKKRAAAFAGIGDAPAASADVRAKAGESQDSPGPRSEGEGFSGWGGLDEVHDLSADEELPDHDDPAPLEDEAGQYSTLSEIALASHAFEPLDGSGHSNKHDELAEAVQAALLSVYGGAPSAPDRKALPLPSGEHASGSGWAGVDDLSPQDVILNYFDYEPGAGQGRGHSGHSGGGDGSGVLGDPQDYASPRYRPQWSGPAAHDDYDSRPDVPESHDGDMEPMEETGRESNKLLSAAAIGLVGGIAIAASLAVFEIVSYGPSARQITGPSQAAEAGDTGGYGRWIKGSAAPEPSKDAAAASLPEPAPVIAASDVPAMPGQPSPLAIEVKPEQADEKRLISITGVPDGARLNAGVDAGGGNWLLPPRRLAGLTINLPAGTSDIVPLGVQVLDGNLRTPLSDTKPFSVHVNASKIEPAVQPVATPPQAQQNVTASLTPAGTSPSPEAPKPAPAPSFFSTETVQTAAPAAALPGPAARQAALRPASPSKTEIEDLLREGNKHMRDGDILAARQFYQKAVSGGDPEAALAMGRTFDPVYFARIGKKNAEPDAAKAFDWYRKAMDGGAGQTAKLRIESLQHFLNQ